MQDDEHKPNIEYGRERRGMSPYERNGWIGLGITLAACLILYLIYAVLR